MNLKSRCGILPVQDSRYKDIKTPPEDQIHQRNTESKDAVLAAASCTTVQMPASAAAPPRTTSHYSLLQSTLADSSVLPAQFTKNSGTASSSSVTADLQLSSIDWEGTFSASPAHGGGTHDPAPGLTVCMKHSHPLGHEAARNSSEYSDAVQSDQQHSDSADDLVSDDAKDQLHKWSLSERILKKISIPSNPSLSEDVVQLESLKCFKQTKETLNPDKGYISSSCQLNKLVQESKKVLSENYARESSVHICQDQYKKADSLVEIMQNDHNINDSTSLALSEQTTEMLHPGCEKLPVSQKPADVVTGCHVKKVCTQTSSKKSVCKNRCSSSEDSDDGNMNKNVQKKRQLNPGQFKKCFTKKRDDVATSKRTNSDSALIIKGNKKKTDFKKTVNSLSLQVSPKPSFLGDVDCFQSPEQPFERSGSGPTQQAESAVLTCAWADSPLPLSERLKGRIKIN